MPIYEYQCQACGHRLEKLQRISDDPLKDCPACSKSELQKLVSAAAFRLKGGGWYETDFKNGSKKNVLHGTDSSNSNEGNDSAKDSSSGEAKSSDSGASTETKKTDSTNKSVAGSAAN